MLEIILMICVETYIISYYSFVMSKKLRNTLNEYSVDLNDFNFILKKLHYSLKNNHSQVEIKLPYQKEIQVFNNLEKFDLDYFNELLAKFNMNLKFDEELVSYCSKKYYYRDFFKLLDKKLKFN